MGRSARVSTEVVPYSRTKTGRFNQADLIAPGSEFATLIALHNNPPT